MTEQRLVCRLPVCEEADTFADVDAVNDSGWTQVNAMGRHIDGGVERRGYCPDHSLEAEVNE